MISGKGSEFPKQHELYLLGCSQSAKPSSACVGFSTDWSESRDDDSDIESNSIIGSKEGVRGRSKTSSSSTFPKMCGSSLVMEQENGNSSTRDLNSAAGTWRDSGETATGFPEDMEGYEEAAVCTKLFSRHH